MLTRVILTLLDNTFGKFIRTIQSLKLDTKVLMTNNVLSVTEEVQKHWVTLSVDYALKNMATAMVFKNRIELWDYVTAKCDKPNPLFLEFGVHKGESIKYISSRLKSARTYGFDSFEGLEEDWTGYSLSKGSFDLGGKMPQVPNHIKLIPGWFSESLPKFLDLEPKLNSIDLLHMDADTYTPTKFVLTTLQSLILPGTIIVFDEYFGYVNWTSHEFKAFKEFVHENQISFTYIGFSDAQVAIQIN